MTTIAELSPAEQLETSLHERFVQLSDGRWYPLDRGTPLVRITVTDGFYRIERRRSMATVWMPLVDAKVAEFDRSTFLEWANAFKLAD